ncbi:MAG: hypothetical protein ACYDA6_04360 [Solirubrobacteraceae bacterium]
MGAGSLTRLAELVRAQGGLLADLINVPPSDTARTANPPGPAQIAAGGPRAARDRGRYELLVEAIYEGYLLHYGQARVLKSVQDDIRLLAGDRLYAMGLAQVVELGDVPAVRELADLIAITAQAQEAGDEELADAVWLAAARAIGWGTSERHDRAKSLAFARAPGALEAMRAAAAG